MNEPTKEAEVSGAVEKTTPETWGELKTTWAQESNKDSTWS